MTKSILNKKGVTLVELLAVVVILGIIAAIAVPTIGGLIERQRQNAAEATYDTIVAAAELYAENENTFTLETLELEDFIDLKDNTFGYMNGATLVTLDKDAIWVKVVGSDVTFYSDAGATTAIDLYINGYDGTPA